mgnify:CR=1 FL=1
MKLSALTPVGVFCFLSTSVNVVLAVQGDDPLIILPKDRYTEWSDTSDGIRASGTSLGYTETTWNEFSASIEAKSYETINDETPGLISDVHNIMDGSTAAEYEASWDCYVNRKCVRVCVELSAIHQLLYTKSNCV